MKVRVSDLPAGTCFRQGSTTKKKLDDDRIVTMSLTGRVRKRHAKDAEVDPVPCPLRLLGLGYRKLPSQVLEIGDGNILKRRRT